MKKINVLFLAADPSESGTNPLKLQEEIRSITERIQLSKYRNMIELISGWAVRPDDLLLLLNQHMPWKGDQWYYPAHVVDRDGERICVQYDYEPKDPAGPPLGEKEWTTIGMVRVNR